MKSIFFLTILCLITSCSIYSPNAINTPLHKKKGELSIGLHAGNGGNLQAAYAVGNHIGIMANAMSVNSEVTVNADVRKGTGNLIEGGLGYFSGNPNKKFCFEIYGGAGLGKVDIDKTFTNANVTRNFTAKGTRFFIQPGIGSVGKIFEIGLSTRLSVVKYKDIKTTYTIDDLTVDNFVGADARTWLFLEPALTLRLGFKFAKLQLQIGRSIKFNKEALGYERGIINFGLVGRI